MLLSLRPDNDEAAEAKQAQQRDKLCNAFHDFTFLIWVVF
jgi:hypothetical protein